MPVNQDVGLVLAEDLSSRMWPGAEQSKCTEAIDYDQLHSNDWTHNKYATSFTPVDVEGRIRLDHQLYHH